MIGSINGDCISNNWNKNRQVSKVTYEKKCYTFQEYRAALWAFRIRSNFQSNNLGWYRCGREIWSLNWSITVTSTFWKSLSEARFYLNRYRLKLLLSSVAGTRHIVLPGSLTECSFLQEETLCTKVLQQGLLLAYILCQGRTWKYASQDAVTCRHASANFTYRIAPSSLWQIIHQQNFKSVEVRLFSILWRRNSTVSSKGHIKLLSVIFWRVQRNS